MGSVTRERQGGSQTSLRTTAIETAGNGVDQSDRYELSLRKLGAWLDAVLAYRITLTEVPRGFVVRYHRQDMEPVFVERFFPHVEVESLRLGDLRLRRRLAGRLGNRLQGVALEPGGYQDLFRALGHEIDRAHAGDTLIREDGMDAILSLTFETPHGNQEMVLGPDDRAALRLEARSRRKRRHRR